MAAKKQSTKSKKPLTWSAKAKVFGQVGKKSYEQARAYRGALGMITGNRPTFLKAHLARIKKAYGNEWALYADVLTKSATESFDTLDKLYLEYDRIVDLLFDEEYGDSDSDD